MRGVVALLLVATGTTHADDKDLDKASVIYARGTALYQSDAKGKGEVELASLPGKVAVRALRTDAKGTVLIADIGGKWWWMPLDGSKKALVELPCGDGPAQVSSDGIHVICRAAAAPTKSVVINVGTGKQLVVDVPAAGARIAVTSPTDRRIIWAEKNGIWSAPTTDPRRKTLLAPESPLRLFLPSNDGNQAIGVYSDFVYEGKVKTPTEMLMTFALDGQGARRKGLKNGVPLEWSHDNQWVLVQDGASACLMRASGGQYKCWKGFTAVSIAPDGSHMLVLGNRDGSKTVPKAPPPKPKTPPKTPPKPDAPVDDEPGNTGPVADDVPVALPSGPLALYRAKLDGVYEAPPALVVKVVDGAAVWVPSK